MEAPRLGHFRNKCSVCALPETLLVQVDDILATPQPQVAEMLFEGIPEEDWPPNVRRWSSLRHAREWLTERGHGDIGSGMLQNHLDMHLPVVPTTRQQIAETGLLASGEPAPTRPEPYMAAVQFHAYFKRGMEVGHKALARLEAMVDADDADGKPLLTPSTLISIARIGQQLAAVQAGIWARGQRFDVEDDDAVSGFMGESDERPSPRFGNVRVRTIDGERRPIRDEGPKDRATYNARAREEGSPELPL